MLMGRLMLSEGKNEGERECSKQGVRGSISALRQPRLPGRTLDA